LCCIVFDSKDRRCLIAHFFFFFLCWILTFVMNNE
jgi:hypothetical protein